MKLRETTIAGLYVAEMSAISDERGWFARIFCERALSNVVGGRHVVQANVSHTAECGAIRGMHFQMPPHQEIKFVRCLRGEVFDVAVDLRQGSPTFLQWHAERLSDSNAYMLCIPEGFAHGFQTLAPQTELLYLHTSFYEKGAEAGLRFDDPRVRIDWPLPVSRISDRDKFHPLIREDFKGIDTCAVATAESISSMCSST